MVTVADKPITAEEFAAMADAGLPTELVRGRVITLGSPKPIHGWICGNITFLLRQHLLADDRGRAFSNDTGVVTERNPDTVRGPDVCYYSDERVPKSTPMDDYFRVAPEIAFEVLSPGNRRSHALAKVAEYLKAGVLVVCGLDPRAKTTQTYRPDSPDEILGPDDEWSAPEVLPGLRIPVRRFFE